MTKKIAGLDYVTIEFNKSGDRINPGDGLVPAGCTDLIVISHGWHSDPAPSQKLYETLLGNLVSLPGFPTAGRTFAVAGIFWPSDKYSDDLSHETKVVLGAGAAAAATDSDLNEEVLVHRAKEVAKFLGIDEQEFVKRVLLAEGGGKDADRLVDILRDHMGEPEDEQTEIDHADLLKLPGRQIFEALKLQGMPALAPPKPPADTGGAATAGENGGVDETAGAAASLFSGAKAALAKLLNQAAYFELKNRAGKIGEKLGILLNDVPEPVRIHLIGHSFGARLVTSAARKLERPAASMCLLQAAFSHNSFCDHIKYPFNGTIKGGFRDVITTGRIAGAIAITHTWNDRAVGVAYPAASRVSQDVAAGLSTSDGFGGTRDAYGGLGANGAMGMQANEGSNMEYNGKSAILLPAGKVTSILSDFISCHTDVARIEVARIVAAAVK